MNAIVCHHYGSPDVLTLEEVEKPTAGDDQVLIRVRAAAINPLDLHLMRGKPYFTRAFSGLRKPRITRPGRDLAGQVEAVGSTVTRFRPGDEVFGVSTGGTFAEFVCARETKVALKPADVTFEQAAAVPVAAVTALQALRDKGRIQPGQKVLFNGATGGVGTFAVQIAKAFGADVTGVCSTSNVDLVRSIGADHVIDRTREDFTRSAQRFDLILDNVGNRSLSEYRRVLTPEGILVLNGGGTLSASAHRGIGPLGRSLVALVSSRFVSQHVVMFLASIDDRDLVALKELMEAGRVTPVVDRCYPLSEVPEALRYLGQGHARGKVVITVGHDRERA